MKKPLIRVKVVSRIRRRWIFPVRLIKRLGGPHEEMEERTRKRHESPFPFALDTE